MEKKQELEWAEAQKLAISQDLVAAAKQQLRFLAEVDRHRHLYDGPALERAIYRYKYFWLPLLAKHAESPFSQGSLVVPLDCEWIWHCHRLNPVRYKKDCKELYGRILGNQNIVSTTQATCKKQTEEIWNRMCANEPYELNMSTQLSEHIGEDILGAQKSTEYDLVSAVKRQSSFYYQVSSPHTNDDIFLEEAVARYKGFLYLIKRNQESSIKRFCVPTYDIDLIWHSHQLDPVSYRNDLVAMIGRVLEHDDTDSDRTKGTKLDVGFSGTTKQWEETFGSRYWRAGAMHKGNAPSPLTINLSELGTLSKKLVASNEYQNMIQLPKKKLVEVMVEIVGVRDLPDWHKGSLFVTLGKKQPDLVFNCRRRLSILSEAREKQVAVFQCEPTGEFAFELGSYSPSVLHIARPTRVLGTISISLEELMKPGSPLWVEKWFEVVPNSRIVGSKPISLRIALSFTPPVLSPFLFHMVQTRPFSSSCFFPLSGRFHHGKSWTCFVDETDNEIINLQMRDATNVEAKENRFSKKEVIGMTTSGETVVLAEFTGTGWSLMNSGWSLQLHKKSNDTGHFFELIGSQRVIIFPGRKLEYEITNCEKHKAEQNSMTAVKFSAEYPYGKAVALFDLKSGFLKINEEWLAFPGILLAFLLSDTLRKDYEAFSSNGEKARDTDNARNVSMQDARRCTEEDTTANHKKKVHDNATAANPKADCNMKEKSIGHGIFGAPIEGVEAVEKGTVRVEGSTCEGDCGKGCKSIINGAICVDCMDGSGAANCGPGDLVQTASCGGKCSACRGGSCGKCGTCRGGGCGGGCGGACSGGRSHGTHLKETGL